MEKSKRIEYYKLFISNINCSGYVKIKGDFDIDNIKEKEVINTIISAAQSILDIADNKFIKDMMSNIIDSANWIYSSFIDE